VRSMRTGRSAPLCLFSFSRFARQNSVKNFCQGFLRQFDAAALLQLTSGGTPNLHAKTGAEASRLGAF
jgi:hypothetical protein